MDNTSIAQLGRIACSFGKFNCSKMWDMWKYKVAPYLIHGNADRNYSIEVKTDFIKEYPQKGALLSIQKAGFFEHRVYRSQDGGVFWEYVRSKNEEIYLQFYVNLALNEIVLLRDCTNSAGIVAFEYLGQIFPTVAIKQDMLTFHGVLMEHEGKGIIISAPSETGKTTHAHLWRDNKNALIINGDRASCQKIKDTWTGFGLPWSGTSGEQINRSVPVTSLVILERGTENIAKRIIGLEAFMSSFPHILYPAWDVELTERSIDMLDDFLQHIPVVRLKCRPDIESVEVLNQLLEEL